MKILHISHAYYPAIGGNENLVKELSEKLVRLGEDVTVFTSNISNAEELDDFKPKKSSLPNQEIINGVNIRRFNINYRTGRLLFYTLPKIRGGYRLTKFIFRETFDALKNGPFIPKVIFKIIKFKPDIVMVLNMHGAQSLFCYLSKKIGKFKLVLIPCFHTNYKWVQYPMIYKIMKIANRIIVFTEFEKNYLVNKGIEGDKISIIGIGIAPERYRKNTAEDNFKKRYNIKNVPIVAFVGRNVNGKGIDTLIDAIDIIWKFIPEAVLIIAGTRSTYSKFIEEKINSLDDSEKNKIIIINDFEEKDKNNIFSICDVFAMPSNSESFGIVYLEAWIHGKPVIACKNSAPATIIEDGKDGLLVSYGAKNELASAIIKLLKNKDMRNKFGENGKKKVLDNYTWDVIGKKIRDEYKRILEDSCPCQR